MVFLPIFYVIGIVYMYLNYDSITNYLNEKNRCFKLDNLRPKTTINILENK